MNADARPAAVLMAPCAAEKLTLVRAGGTGHRRIQLLADGSTLKEALEAADALQAAHGISADVWSVKGSGLAPRVLSNEELIALSCI